MAEEQCKDRGYCHLWTVKIAQCVQLSSSEKYLDQDQGRRKGFNNIDWKQYKTHQTLVLRIALKLFHRKQIGGGWDLGGRKGKLEKERAVQPWTQCTLQLTSCGVLRSGARQIYRLEECRDESCTERVRYCSRD